MAEVHEFGDVEWTIENFSCWNENVHSAVISREFGGALGVLLNVQLRPKGLEEHLMVTIICNEPEALLIDFSIIGPDGSILSNCDPELERERKLFNLSLIGPTFDEVVAHIRKYEALHEDRLTLKFRIKGYFNTMVVARTEVPTIRASWKISSDMLKNLSPGFNWISKAYYPLGGSMGEMDLIVLKGDSDIDLRLDHESSFQKKVLVFVNVSVLGKDCAVLATGVKVRMFRETENWIFFNSPLTKDTMEFFLVLRIKIVPSQEYKHQSGYHMPIYFSKHCQVATSCHQYHN